MRKIKFPSLLMLVVILLTFTRCQLFPESESTALNDIIGYFDFRTTQDVSMNIFFMGQQNTRLPNVPFEISTSPNFENNQSVFAQLTTGAYGTADVKSNLPTVIDSIYVRVNYPGVTPHSTRAKGGRNGPNTFRR